MGCRATCAQADGRGLGTQDNGLVIEVDPGRFEDMVVTALDGLPEELGRLMRNVTVEHGAGPRGIVTAVDGHLLLDARRVPGPYR
jgi:hypothetical protein